MCHDASFAEMGVMALGELTIHQTA